MKILIVTLLFFVYWLATLGSESFFLDRDNFDFCKVLARSVLFTVGCWALYFVLLAGSCFAKGIIQIFVGG